MSEQQLNEAILEIRQNMSPDQVFTPDELIKWVRDHVQPQDVWGRKALEATIQDLKEEVV